MLCNLEHPENNCFLIIVRFSGKEATVIFLQSLKADSPMLVTLFGMAMEVRLLHKLYLQLTVYQSVLVKTVEK